MGSADDEERALRTSRDQIRRSTGMYRGAGAVMGGVEPLFEYDEEGVMLDQFEEEDESADERKALVKPGVGQGGERRDGEGSPGGTWSPGGGRANGRV